jgi:hypothetical protein
MTVVILQDVKTADPIHGPYCARGLKIFFQLHRLDFRKFIKEGIPEEELLATGDHSAVKVVEAARRREDLSNG